VDHWARRPDHSAMTERQCTCLQEWR
jgi:hypothetical protein